MIGLLKGKVIRKETGKIIVEVNGVGYEVNVNARLNNKLVLDEQVVLDIYTHVREEVLALYGFADQEEKQLFEKLISVSGIGPKMAMTVMESGSKSEIVEAIRNGNVSFFTAVPGIGTKGAQRLIVDLKSKLGGDEKLDLADYPNQADALKGLVALGLTKAEAFESLKKIDGRLSAEEQIRLALRDGRR